MNLVPLRYLSRVPITNGLGLSGANDNPEWPRYIRTTDIAGPTTLREDVFASQPPEVAEAAMVESGDILMTAAGASIGKSVRFSDVYPACYAGFLVRVRPHSETEGRFLGYWMQSGHYWDQIRSGAVKSTIENFSAGRYRSLLAPQPEVSQQRAVVAYLDREVAKVDALVSEQEGLVSVLRERRTALIARVVATGLNGAPLRASTLDWVETVPDHWTVANIRRFAKMKTGHTPSRSKPEYWVDCTIPWFTLADVWQLREGKRKYLGQTEAQISQLGLKNSAAELLPAGTVVLSRTASVGFSGIMPEPMATSQDFWNWVCGPRLLPEYLLWVFRAMREEFNALMIGSTHKTIYQPVASAIRIPVPPVSEQGEIVEYLDEETKRIDALIAEAEGIVAVAKERRSALITAAVTGQIDVRGEVA